MGFLFASKKSNAAQTPSYTGMQLQSSAYGVCVPVVYGTSRIGWNLADYVGFKSISTPQQSHGGKGGVVGGGGKGGGGNSITYSASILGTICEGPITGVASSWSSQTQLAGTPGFSIFTGAFAQTAWSYLSSNYPTHALTYSGFAYAAGADYDLGNSANLPNINWEVQGFLQGTAPGTYGGNGCVSGGDADASQIVPDILTNTTYGISFPSTRVGQVVTNNQSTTVPGGAHKVTVTHAATFLYNLCVYSGSTVLTCVTGTPGTNQYSVSAGVYTFNAANVGASIVISYASLSTLTDYQNFTLASGLWISPAYTQQAQTASVIDDIMKATYSEVVWSSGILQVIPRGTQAITANGHTYTPSTTPLFSLTVDDFMENSNGSGDPIVVTRKRKSDQLNSIKYEVMDRANQYAMAIVEIKDQAQIDKYGPRPGASQTFHMFCDLAAANVSANLQLQDQYLLNSFQFKLDERFCVLDPMDLVEITDPYYSSLSLSGVRILDMVENDDGTLDVMAEEYTGTLGTVPAYNLDVGGGTIQDFNVNPGNAAAPAVFDVPVQLAQVIGLETWLATHSASGNSAWGGCDIYISSDNTSFFRQGTIVGNSRMGTLTATFPSGSDPDTTHTLSVNLADAMGVLDSGTTSDADQANTICFVDGEYVSYSTATLTSTYHYNLTTYLRRGQWGSQISSHASGSLFVRLDDSVFKLPYNATDNGKTIYIKLVSFNIFGGGHQDLSSVTTYSHTIGGPPVAYAPSGLSATAAIKGIQLNWTNAPDIGIAAVEIWRSASSAFGSATNVADAAAYATSYNDQTVSSNTQYWYWIRYRDISGNETAYTPSSSGAGATNTSAQVATADIANGAVTSPKIASGVVPALILAAGLNAVQVVTSIGSANPAVSNVAFLTTDSQLYRYNGSTWTVAVPAVNVGNGLTAAQISSVNAAAVGAGLTASQIASVAAATITVGQLTSSQIASVAAASVTGTLVNSQLGSGSVTAATIAANTITAGNIAAGAITTATIAAGAITTGTIAAGAITTATIAAGAITTATIAAGTIVAGNIAANTITGAQIAATTISAANIVSGTITASQIAASTITATQIAAATITGTKIAAGTITASNMDVNSVTAGTIAAGAINASGIIVSNIIVTGHIQANQVTVPAGASGSGDQNITIGTTGGSVIVWGIVSLPSFGYNPYSPYFYVMKGGTTMFTGIANFGDNPFVFVDSPGTGSINYAVDTGGFSNSSAIAGVEFLR
jgi:hypothetical protein